MRSVAPAKSWTTTKGHGLSKNNIFSTCREAFEIDLCNSNMSLHLSQLTPFTKNTSSFKNNIPKMELSYARCWVRRALECPAEPLPEGATRIVDLGFSMVLLLAYTAKPVSRTAKLWRAPI